MSVYVTGSRRPRGALRLDPSATRELSITRRVKAGYALLFINTLTYFPGGVINLPSKFGKAIPNVALPLAILLLLSVIPKIKLRPNVFLCLVTLLAIDTVLSATQVDNIGTDYRTL